MTRARALALAALVVVVTSMLATSSRAAPAGASNATPSTVWTFGAPFLGAPAPTSPAVVGVTAGINGVGYDVLRANGAVNAYGTPSDGSLSLADLQVGVTATGIALDAATGGYWVLTSNGMVRGFDAPFLGDTIVPPHGWGQHPAAVAIAATPSGSGYYVLRANGAVYGYGVATRGSLAGHLHYGTTAPVLAVAIAVDPATGGYWIATSTGGVFGFDAPKLGSALTSADGHYDGVPTSGLVATADGSGYYELRANGDIDAFHAPSPGSPTTSTSLPPGGFASGIALNATAGGLYVAFDATPLDGYLNPLRALTSLLPQEVDQGVDYCGSGPIYALGRGVVVNLYDGEWPSGVFISYRLTSGPAKGRYVYDAENVTPRVVIGQRVTTSTVVGDLHDAKTCLETGWADPPASPETAAAHRDFNGKNSTAYGLNFNALLQALGARPGLPQPFGPPGVLAAGWPTW